MAGSGTVTSSTMVRGGVDRAGSAIGKNDETCSGGAGFTTQGIAEGGGMASTCAAAVSSDSSRLARMRPGTSRAGGRS